jgi:hypothetical protein
MPVGCIAVAMGQIMAYHEWPLIGSYLHPQYSILTPHIVVAQYNWTAMKANANASNLSATGKSGVANLLAEAGRKLNMDYGCNGSSAYTSDVPQAFSQMGYTTSSVGTFNWSNITNDIQNDRPIYVSGISSEGKGHAWIIEGYQSVAFNALYERDCPDGTTEEVPVSSVSRYVYFNLGLGGGSVNHFYSADIWGGWAYPQSVKVIYNIHPN